MLPLDTLRHATPPANGVESGSRKGHRATKPDFVLLRHIAAHAARGDGTQHQPVATHGALQLDIECTTSETTPR